MRAIPRLFVTRSIVVVGVIFVSIVIIVIILVGYPVFAVAGVVLVLHIGPAWIIALVLLVRAFPLRDFNILGLPQEIIEFLAHESIGVDNLQKIFASVQLCQFLIGVDCIGRDIPNRNFRDCQPVFGPEPPLLRFFQPLCIVVEHQ